MHRVSHLHEVEAGGVDADVRLKAIEHDGGTALHRGEVRPAFLIHHRERGFLVHEVATIFSYAILLLREEVTDRTRSLPEHLRVVLTHDHWDFHYPRKLFNITE